jgi:hypothetical protein
MPIPTCSVDESLCPMIQYLQTENPSDILAGFIHIVMPTTTMLMKESWSRGDNVSVSGLADELIEGLCILRKVYGLRSMCDTLDLNVEMGLLALEKGERGFAAMKCSKQLTDSSFGTDLLLKMDKSKSRLEYKIGVFKYAARLCRGCPQYDKQFRADSGKKL